MYRRLLALAVPAIISNLLYTSHIIADTAMLGRYGEADVSIAALGLGMLLMFMFFPAVAGLTTGAVALIARRWGEGRLRSAQSVGRDSLALMLALSIPISLLGLTAGPHVIHLLGAKGDVLVQGTLYIRALFAFYPFNLIILTYHGLQRAAGDTRTPMYVDIITNLYNIGMNYLLIFGKFGFPEMGVLGAGVATGTAYLLGASVYAFLHARKKLLVTPRIFARRRIGWGNIKKMFRIGMPAGADMGMWTISSLLLTPMIFHFGEVAYSAYQIGFRAEAIAYMPAIGFGVASTTLAGQYLGARKSKMAERAVLSATKLVMIAMAFIGILMIVLPGGIARLFTDDAGVIELAALYIFLMGFTEPALGAFFTLIGGMRGAGYTRVPMLVNFGCIVVLRLSLSYILAFPVGLGLKGIFLAMLIDNFVRVGIIYTVFRRGRWKDVKV